MQSLNDDDMKALLRKWVAPNMPPAVEKTILASAPAPTRPFSRWLTTGSICIPAPIAVAIVVMCILLGVYAHRSGRPAHTSLADFQPVTEFNPRIIRSVYEPK